MNLDNILDSKVICVIIAADKFNEEILNLVQKIKNKKICYVTLNKSANTLVDSFNKKRINLNDFFFIDCVSKTIITPKPLNNCYFVSSPNALTEISLEIGKCIYSGFSIILIDSLSTFMIYHNTEEINHFFHNISNTIRSEEGKNLVLTISSNDKDSDVFKKIEIIVDKVIELK